MASTHLKHMIVKLDHLPKLRDEHKKYLSCHHLETNLMSRRKPNQSSPPKTFSHVLPVSQRIIYFINLEALANIEGMPWNTRWAPDPVIYIYKCSYNSYIRGVITTRYSIYLFSDIYRGYNRICNGQGPTLYHLYHLWKNIMSHKL